MSRTLSTLSGIDRFQSGIGAGDDLEVSLRADPAGRWFARLHPGFYYYGVEEGYLYAQRGETVFTVSATGTVSTFSVSGLPWDVTQRGPVLLYRDNADGSQTRIPRVCSPLRAF